MATHTIFRSAVKNPDALGNHSPMKSNKNSQKNIWLKSLGLLFTAVLTISVFAPNTINIPIGWRPWLFVIFVFWIVFYVSGLFTL